MQGYLFIQMPFQYGYLLPHKYEHSSLGDNFPRRWPSLKATSLEGNQNMQTDLPLFSFFFRGVAKIYEWWHRGRWGSRITPQKYYIIYEQSPEQKHFFCWILRYESKGYESFSYYCFDPIKHLCIRLDLSYLNT